MMADVSADQPSGTARWAFLGSPRLIKIALLTVVATLVLGPVIVLLRASLAPPDVLPFETSIFTLDNFRQIFAGNDTVNLLTTTIAYAAGSVLLGVGAAALVAWLTERTDMPGATAIRIFLFSWMAVPPLVIGFGWVLLINPGNGALNVFARSAFGLTSPPFTIYSFWSLIIITAFSVLPTAYVMLGGLFSNMDPQLESAGQVHGGRSFTVMRRITLPLLIPGILSVSIFMVMIVVQAFEIPFVVGLSAQIRVLSTRVYLLASPTTGIPNYGLSSAFGVCLLGLACLLMGVYFRCVGTGEKYRVVTGKAFRPRRQKLGVWRVPVTCLVFALFGIMVLPVLMILWTSFMASYQVPSLSALATLSLDNYSRALASPFARQAIFNTLILVLASATIVMLLGSLIAWFSVRDRGPAVRILDILAFAPTAIPPVVMVIAILLVYIRTPVYGTIWILVLSSVTVQLAFATRTMTSALTQLHKELGDAATVCGAGWWTSFRRITLPLLRVQFMSGWLFVAAHTSRDLTIPLVLMTSSNVVLASAIWMMWDFPDLPGAAAMAVLLVIGLLAVVLPVQILANRGRRDA
ncbi:ABC transporter permease [Microvirga subterranea]|uniref:Iron(III) transport system permease protein n=1 Tax=Microvirga subterranea TaxID=186651 RepID=A0A370HA62_9HYPH|nr:iron ABC transporter permease [Microvirga subterranea]RDI53829.1 iron(III) transport system permease protein [Microvirga subterranea]